MSVVEIQSSREWEAKHAASVGTNKAVCVDFSAVWCGPCKAVAPLFAQFAKEFTNIVFLKVDVDANPDIASECGVRAMPTFQIFKAGKKVDEVVGANVKTLGELLKKHNAASGAFTGKGRILAGESAASAAPEPAAAAASAGAWEGPAEGPTTGVQVRLADGSRLAGRFNPTQTVADLHRFIAAQAGASAAGYQLLAGFPARPLLDGSATLEAAGLLNSVVTQQRKPC